MKKLPDSLDRHTGFPRLRRSSLFAFLTFLSLAALPSFSATNLAWRIEYGQQDRIAARIDPAGRVTRYSYTPPTNGPLQSVTQSPPDGAPVTWRFDAEGRLASMTDGEGELAYRYDKRGKLEAVARQGAPEVHYTYDTAGRLAELRVGNFYRVAWTYDFLGRIEKMDTPAGPVSYEYLTGQNTVVRALPNGIKTFWKRQANGQLEEITHGFFKNPNDSKYSVLAEYAYQHGPDGRIAAIRESSGQNEVLRRYAYDTLGRLVRATGSGGREYGYSYDPVGDRLKATATGRPGQDCAFDWAGRLTSVDGKSCTYDECGNLTEVTLAGVARQFRYQPDGRLAEARVGGESVKYDYDGLGRLIVRKTSAGQTRFIPDPLSEYWQPLVMEGSDGKRTMVIWDGNAPLAIMRDGQTEWLLHDHLGSIRLVTDGKGNVKQQRQYDPFGVPEEAVQTAALSPGFAGLFWDEQANGYLALARFCIPELGSFLQPDPKKTIPSTAAEYCSLYTYCRGNPVTFVDRDGADPVSLDSTTVWWDAFFDALRHPPNYIVDYGPMPRDAVMNQVYHSAFNDPLPSSFITDGNVDKEDLTTRAYFRTLQWRYNAAALQKAFPNPDTRPTAAELRNVENQLYAQMTVVTGKNRDATVFGIHLPDFDARPGTESAKIEREIMIPTWSVAHWFIENFNLKNSIDRNGLTLAQDPKTLQRQFMGADTGERWANANSIARDYEKVFVAGLGDSYSYSGHKLSPQVPQIPFKELKPPEQPDEIKKMKPYVWLPPPGGGDDGGGGGGSGRWGGGGGGLSPSPVGGVYLGGAGGAIDGLGSLKGIRLDSIGNLVLVSEDGGEVKLPPLRLDDLVTVFRSVYLNGEGPTVTIDPNPEDPEKSAMIIVHSDATKDTYVGWVLYEADRLMKGYTLGVDNITTNNVVSRVPGYREIVDTIYFGGEDPRKSQKQGNWERFWIVPAEANRFEGTRRELTLFDVPLKVKTQKMKWEKNKLVDDLTGKSSPGAEGFASWFTKNYEGISAEQYLLPPRETGLTNPVPVFAELRRIALMTAIAEKLRDQGVPLPFWMRDYEVKPVPFEKTSPGMEVTRSNGKVRARIFGGVELSPESRAIKTYATSADVSKAPPETRAQVERSVKLADSLETAVEKALPPVPTAPLTVYRVEDNNRAYEAFSVPGAKTLALDPCRLDEVDLAVPVVGGRGLRLARSFNSFFDPKGPWGKGWALDLPRLQETRVPVSREGSKVRYATRYEVLTPLNSLYARFSEIRPVPELQNSKLQVPDQESPFFGLADAHPKFLKNSETQVLYLKDGTRWHFTKHGELVAIEDGPQVTVYERGDRGQVTRIVAALGGARAGQIELAYTREGTLAKAVGTTFGMPTAQPVEVIYNYDSSGRLTGVNSSEGKVGYRYQGPWVSSVTWTDQTPGAQPKELSAFEYNAQGQLTSEKRGKSSLQHAIAAAPGGGVEASVGEAAENGRKTFTRYDRQMRPIEAKEADGTSTLWAYQPGGGIRTTVTMPDKRKVTVVESAGGRQRTVQADGAPEITAKFDAGGRLTTYTENGQTLLEQKWQPDGQIDEVVTGPRSASFQYTESGLLSSVMEHPTAEKGKFEHWQETSFDRRGFLTHLTDFCGLDVGLTYDAAGRLVSAVQKTPKGNEGYNIERDNAGHVLAVKSSWGNTSYVYAKDGDLQRVETKCGKESASVELSSGLVRKITGFDKSVTTFDYHDNGDMVGALRGVTCANGLKLAHDYDAKQRLVAVAVGTDQRVRLDYDAKGRVVTYALEPLTP